MLMAVQLRIESFKTIYHIYILASYNLNIRKKYIYIYVLSKYTYKYIFL